MEWESATLTFANFKQIIPSQILARGRDYARGGHIKKIGELARAEARAGRLRNHYPNRPALHDELRRV